MVCLGKGRLSILDPMDKVPQDENKTKSSHSYCSLLCDSCHFRCGRIMLDLYTPFYSLSKTSLSLRLLGLVLHMVSVMAAI